MPTQFPHLQFVSSVARTFSNTGGSQKSLETKRNEDNIAGHGQKLSRQLFNIQQQWQRDLEAAAAVGLETADGETIPLFLQIDPELYDIDKFVKAWDIEIISEEENGFIIASSKSAKIPKLVAKLQKMMSPDPYGTKGMAQLWNIETRDRSLESVIGTSLLERWTTLEQEKECWVDVSINVGMHMPGPPPAIEATVEYQAWLDAINEYDELSEERQAQLRLVVESNEGSIESEFVSLGDTCDCRVKISGLGIKNIFFYLPYIWEIVESDIAGELRARESEIYAEYDPDILAPAPEAPRVCVIDSGMQSGHRLLYPAIKNNTSYVIGDSSTADAVGNGGHGTRVGGAVLYPNGIPRSGTYQPIAWLQNARILEEVNGQGCLNKALHLPSLMGRIVADHLPTRLYNMSVTSWLPHLRVHMSAWAAAIDQLSYEYDVLFIVCTGNIDGDVSKPRRKGILQHLATGTYPSYLIEPSCSIANPSQSCQAITVGSVSYDKISTATHQSFGEKDMPSAFSRSGLGMWGMVKPDVVEYGGDSVHTTAGTLVNLPDACPELVSSTLTSSKAVSRDVVGTSFAAPKVAHIAAALQALYPDSKTLLYRALIAQSAHWPEHAEHDVLANKLFHFRTLGYGIPNLERATENTEARVTFITESTLTAKNAKIYVIKIPGISSPGDTSEYRIEVTLSYVARPRRTRRRLHSYLSTTLQWKMAHLGESLASFKGRLQMPYNEALDDERPAVSNLGTTRVKWQLGKNPNHYTRDIRIQDSTLQKDWAFVKGYTFPTDNLIFAVTGHEGWEKNEETIPFAFAVTITSLDGRRIYEQIELANRIEIEGESGL